MTAVVFEHVPVAELPEKCRTNLVPADGALMTVRIEQEVRSAPTAAAAADAYVTDDPAFGIWRNCEDVADVAAYVPRIRQPRYERDGSRHEL